MIQPAAESRVLKQDAYFKLQRIVTSDGHSLLAKFAIADLYGAEDALLASEYRIFAQLSSARTLRPVRLDTGTEHFTAYYADIAGSPISIPTRGDARRTRLIEIVTDLCATLTSCHERGVILTGLTPQSFLYDSSLEHVVLTDALFAHSAQFPRETDERYWLGSSCLPYAAPEVIGRAAHAVDCRADLYSLAAVLFELLCQRPLFEVVDPAELIQCHLAKKPPSLLDIDPSLPRGFHDAFVKLLAKNPSDRFGTAAEAEDALLSALGTSRPSGLRLASFGSKGASSAVPTLSRKLYGRRDAEQSLLEKVLKTRARPALCIVEGDAGIGKTSLLDFARSLVTQGHYCRGRFIQKGPIAPLAGWTSALQDLARVVLKKPSEDVSEWRQRLSKALGEGAILISTLVPEWGAVLGHTLHPKPQALDSMLNRLAMAIHGLLRCYAQPDAPVVLVLDDIQWADSSSLAILELLLTQPEPLNLLVLAGYRARPDGPRSGPVDEFTSRLRAAKVDLDHLQLNAFGPAELHELLRDSFGYQLAEPDPLVDVLLARTKGNPFFVHELLRTLIRNHTLAFDEARRTWSWPREPLRALPAEDSVAEFLTRRVRELAPALRHALELASCLGPTFTLSNFARCAEHPEHRAALDLEPAIAEGLLLSRTSFDKAADPVGVVYEFAHDRVHEACLGLLSRHERAEVCLRIGRLLSAGRDRSELTNSSHGLAAFFNAARGLISDEAERFSCAALNLEAGTRAKERGAFSQALEHFESGLDFLQPPARPSSGTADYHAAWRVNAGLTRALLEEAAEGALLNAKFERMHELCGALLAHAAEPLEKVRATEIRIYGLSAEKLFREAVTTGCDLLSELGIRFPKRPRITDVVIAYLRTKRNLVARSVEGVIDLPTNNDPVNGATSRLVQAMYSSAYFSHRTLFPLLVCRHINISLQHGYHDYSCVTFIGFAIVLAAMGEYQLAFGLGRVTLELAKRPGADPHWAKVLMGHYVFAFPWTHHLRESIPHLTEGIQAGLQRGDFEYAGHLLTLHTLARVQSGQPLNEIADEAERHRLKIISLRQERSIIMQALHCQMIADLRASSPTATPLGGPYYVEETMLPRCLEPLDQNLAFSHYHTKTILCTLLGNRDAALEAADRVRPLAAAGAFGLYTGAIFIFYDSLLGAWAGRRRGVRAMRSRWRARWGARRLRKYARSAPMNFLHRYHLVQAARLWDRPDRAAFHFERAIELSQTHGYLQDTALAYEWAAEFHLERGMERLGRHYLRESYAAYRRWGATAVAQRLEQTYSRHFAAMASGLESSRTTALATFSENIDYRVLLEAFRAISAEIRLPRLLERLLRAMFEHAGAQRALLVVERRGKLMVHAEADVDEADIHIHPDEPAEASTRLCRSIVRYVARTASPIVIDDATSDERFNDDPYVPERSPKSVLCAPLIHQTKLLGVVYLENNRVSHVFTRARREVVSWLAGQAAVSIATARTHELELEAQQSKINPHLLFNALSSIAELAVEDGSRAEAAILKLAHLYRYVLVTSAEELVTLEQELEVVRSYLALEKLRFGPRLTFDITYDESLKSTRVPGLLIQPLVENSVRHGISPKLAPGHIWVEATQSDGRCQIIVQDDGDGLKHGTAGTGFGLRSVQDRLALIYGRDYTFAITRRGGYRVELQVPLAPSQSA